MVRVKVANMHCGGCAKGVRAALSRMAPGVAADIRETGFQFRADGPVPSFYWIDQGFGYALAGPVPRDTLMKLAEAVYCQL